jgi:hypothetical protein
MTSYLVPRGRNLVLALGGALLSIACGGGDDPPGDGTMPEPTCPFGDLSLPAEMQIIHLDAANNVFRTQPMQEVPLIAPPQGGWINLIGVRARNIDGCRTTLTVALQDMCDNELLTVDQRPTQLEVDSEGWGASSLTTFSNLPVCPHVTTERDLNSVPYTVVVRIEDSNGQMASSTITLVPVCPGDPSRCSCECDREYTLGKECPTVDTPYPTCPAPAS